MGTNFYWKSTACETCGHSAESVHIGKSSAGWCFGVHVYPENPELPQSWDAWKDRFALLPGVIEDEYGDVIVPDEMLQRVEQRSWKPFDEHRWGHWYYESEADFHAKNKSERGPNGLLRHQIDGRHCIGHGEGTWDYLIGYFS